MAVDTPIVNTFSDAVSEYEEPSVWTEHHENILIEWADKATCFRWLHAKSHIEYSKANTWFTIPVIVMSTLTGTANFAQDRFPPDIKPAIDEHVLTECLVFTLKVVTVKTVSIA